jgi:NADH:ubiquinone oxidoreductase subunit 5 (subunit L)/multisubunit Na+/H+ antiporter MnhA subunit
LSANPRPPVFAFLLLSVGVVLTAFYSWRLIFMTFHGAPARSGQVMSHVHESAPVMLHPLYVLAAGALFAGLFFAGPFIERDSRSISGRDVGERRSPDGGNAPCALLGGDLADRRW